LPSKWLMSWLTLATWATTIPRPLPWRQPSRSYGAAMNPGSPVVEVASRHSAESQRPGRTRRHTTSTDPKLRECREKSPERNAIPTSKPVPVGSHHAHWAPSLAPMSTENLILTCLTHGSPVTQSNTWHAERRRNLGRPRPLTASTQVPRRPVH
jgi:hypothetical protein